MSAWTAARRFGVAGVVLGLWGASLAFRPLGVNAQSDQPQEGLAQATEDDFRHARSLSRVFQQAARTVEPSVVHITTESERIARDLFGRRFRQQASGLGSGVIVSKDGYILTNNHVIEGATRLYARLYDGRTVDAEVIGGDELRDIAVIKISAEDLQPAEFGDSNALEVGEWVLAVGSPFGFDQTVTAGIVSAKGRGLGIVRDEFKDAEDFIQTDAAINPGNSGGPLINLDGKVVGINSAIFSRTGGSVGLGFSIPVHLAMAVYENIRGGGRSDFGYLGVRFEPGSPATISEVLDESPAQQAGLRPGDRIVRFQGRPIEGVEQLVNSIKFSPPGSTATVEIERDGSPLKLNARLGALTQAELQHYGGREIQSVGLAVITATEQLVGAGEGSEGFAVFVYRVEPGAAAARAGLKQGDLINAVDGKPVRTVEELVEALGQAGARVRIDLRRGEMQGWTTLER